MLSVDILWCSGCHLLDQKSRRSLLIPRILMLLSASCLLTAPEASSELTQGSRWLELVVPEAFASEKVMTGDSQRAGASSVDRAEGAESVEATSAERCRGDGAGHCSKKLDIWDREHSRGPSTEHCKDIEIILRVKGRVERNYFSSVSAGYKCLVRVRINGQEIVHKPADEFAGNATLLRDQNVFSRSLEGFISGLPAGGSSLQAQLFCDSFTEPEDDQTTTLFNPCPVTSEQGVVWRDGPLTAYEAFKRGTNRTAGEGSESLRFGYSVAGGVYFGPPAHNWIEMSHPGLEGRQQVLDSSLPFDDHTEVAAPTADGQLEPIHFVVVSPARNCEAWIPFGVESVLAQNYKNWEMVIVDDASTDNTAEAALGSTRGDQRIRLISNVERKGALFNTYTAIEIAEPANEDVIIVLDGDDWLAHPDVMTIVASRYAEGAWLTYGTYIEYPTGLSPDWILDFPTEVVDRNLFRRFPFKSSHLRTFKMFLFASLDMRQFCYDTDIGWGPECATGGRFFDRAGADVAVMLPLLERAGERMHRIDQVLHVYNIATPLNDYKVHLEEQWNVDAIVRSRPPLERLQGSRRPGSAREAKVTIFSPTEGQAIVAQEPVLHYVVDGVWIPEEAEVIILLDQRFFFRSRASDLQLTIQSELGLGEHSVEVELVDYEEEVLASALVSFTFQ